MALTPEDVLNKNFTATQFRRGYDEQEVDDFLDEVVAELRRLTQERDDLSTQLADCRKGKGAAPATTAGATSSDAPTVTGTVPAGSGDDAAEQAQRQAAARVAAARAEAEQAEKDAAERIARARDAATRAEAESADRLRSTAGAAGTRGAEDSTGEPDDADAAGLGGAAGAAGVIALAQKLHDEYVRNGEQTRDRIVGEAREHSTRLMREAEEKQRQTLGSLEQERSLLERKIDELRAFEREYRSRLKSYLEGQLRELDAKATVVPNRGGGSPSSAPAPAATVGASQAPYSGPLPTRGGYADAGSEQPAQYPFGGQN